MSRNLLLLGLALMTWGVGEGMFLSFVPLYLEKMGANPQEIGNILGIIGMAMAAAHLPAGYLSDRIGRRPLLFLAWFMGLASAWTMALSQTLNMFILGAAIYGLTAFVSSPLNSYITAARGKWSVGRAITLISALYNIGAILGPLLGGWIGSRTGLHNNFQATAYAFMLSTAIILFIQPQPVERSAPGSDPARPAGLLNRRYLLFLGVTFLAMFAMVLAQPLSQNFLQNQRGLDLVQIGQLLAARSAGVVLLNLTLGHLSARRGFLLALVGMILFTILLWQGAGFWWFLGGYFLLGSYQTARSLANAQGRALVESANMGLAYGMIEMTIALATILAPPIAGFLYTQNPTSIYTTSLVLICGALVVTVFVSPLSTRLQR